MKNQQFLYCVLVISAVSIIASTYYLGTIPYFPNSASSRFPLISKDDWNSNDQKQPNTEYIGDTKDKEIYALLPNSTQVRSFGITHHRSNLEVFLRYCKFNNYTPVLPVWNLAAGHNRRRHISSNFTDYFDFSTLQIGGEPFRVLLTEDEIPEGARERGQVLSLPSSHNLLRLQEPFNQLPRVASGLPVTFDYSSTLISVANQVIDEMVGRAGNPFASVHARRGDKLRFVPSLDNSTSALNIDAVLSEVADCPRDVYVMTNDWSEHYMDSFNELNNNSGKKERHYHLYRDFELLKRENERDNYALFLIEKIMMDRAAVRISTFKTKNPQYSHGYLDMNWGHQ